MTPPTSPADAPPSGPRPAHEQLRRLLDELDEARREARELAADLTARQLWWRPEPGRWSVGECLDHLVRTWEAYLPGIERALARAEDEGLTADGPFGRGFLGRWIVRTLEPPPGLRIPAPEAFLPRRAAPDGLPATERGSDGPRSTDGAPGGGTVGDASPLRRFLRLQDRFARRIERGDGLDLEAVRVASPVLPLVSLNLYAVFCLLTAHQRRHLWQARKVTEADGWPGGG